MRDATRGSAIRLLAEVGGRVLSLASSFLIAVGLGVEGFGLYAALSGVALLLAETGDLGLQATASRALVAGTLTLGDVVRARLLLSGLVAGVALALGAALRVAAFDWAPVLVLLIGYFALSNWTEFLGVCLRARGRKLDEAAVLVLLRGMLLAAAALAFGAGGGLERLAVALLASALLPLAVAAFLARRAYPETAAALRPVRAVLRTSLPLALNAALALVSLRVETLALILLRGPREAGLFAVALKLIESLLGVPAAICGGAMPALTREALRGGGGVRGRTAGSVALLCVPAAAGLGLLAPGVLELLGGGYAEAAVPLRVLAAAVVATYMNAVLLHALIAAGRAEVLPRLTAVRVAVAVALAALLVPWQGAVGAASGFLAGELALLLLASRACARAGFEVPVARPLFAAACVTLPMAVGVALLGRGALTAAALGVAIYAATLAAAWHLTPRLLASVRQPAET